MKSKLSLFALLVMIPASRCIYAQDADAPPVNVKSVMATLNEIKQKQHNDIKATETALAQTLMATSQNLGAAIQYYENAVYNTQFNGQSHETTEFQDWKKKHEADLKDPNFRSALCLHLMYLSLTVSHDSGVKVKDLLPGLLSYTQQVLANETGLAGQDELMEEPLSKSVIVRSLQIGQYVADDQTWVPIPIKVDKIFDKVILPEYRAEKNAAGIFQYWDARIQREEAAADSLKRTLEIEKFASITKPSLLWQRSEEYIWLGQKNNAINKMVEIIKAYPYHPDGADWIAQVEKLVASAAPAPAPSPADASTPAPATSSTSAPAG